MLKIEEINEEIEKLENCENVSYNLCEKLAILYIVRDHMHKSSDIISPLKSS